MKLFTSLPLFLLLVSSVYASREVKFRHPISLPSDIQRFIKDKKDEAHTMAVQLNLNLPNEFWGVFDKAASGDIEGALNAYFPLKQNYKWEQVHEDGPTVSVPAWQELAEVIMIIEAVTDKDWPSCEVFAKSIIKSIPPGSIYFGGSDAGRGLITALSKSHRRADPFFTLTQNQLIDAHYLEYLQWLYGKQIHLPDKYDLNAAREGYLEDAFKRLQHDLAKTWEPQQVKREERLSLKDGKVVVGSGVATMEVNALLAERIFKENPNHEFYIEVSLPMDWMYPHLSPHGFILKLNRERLKEISEPVIQSDREFWSKQQRATIGSWLKPGTSLSNVCAFLKKSVTGNQALPRNSFLKDIYGPLLFAHSRCNIGHVYFWHMNHANSPEERKQMTLEAELAYQQALCFCPLSGEAIFGYEYFLLSQGRAQDAEFLAGTYHALQPENPEVTDLFKHLQRTRTARSDAR